jgi:hypothetical protein
MQLMSRTMTWHGALHECARHELNGWTGCKDDERTVQESGCIDR